MYTNLNKQHNILDFYALIFGVFHYFSTGIKAPEWLQYPKYPNEVVVGDFVLGDP